MNRCGNSIKRKKGFVRSEAKRADVEFIQEKHLKEEELLTLKEWEGQVIHSSFWSKHFGIAE